MLYIINWKCVVIFIIGMIIGAYIWSRPIATINTCMPICEEQFEQYNC